MQEDRKPAEKESGQEGEKKAMMYRVCPHCGSNLDPNERCDCQQEKRNEPDKAAERRKEEEKEHGKIQRNRA